jgi:hypothetical protein
MEIEFGQRPFEKGLESFVVHVHEPNYIDVSQKLLQLDDDIQVYFIPKKDPRKAKTRKTNFGFLSSVFSKLTYVVYFMI